MTSCAVCSFSSMPMHVDVQLKCLKDQNGVGTKINEVSKEEYLKNVEIFHCVVKERARLYCAIIQFDHLHMIMVAQLMIATDFNVNAFVWKRGVPQIIFPLTMAKGKVLEFNVRFRAIFGEFLQTYADATRTIKSRTVHAITVGPSVNFQGGIRCFSLASGKLMHRSWKDLHSCKIPINTTNRINCI